ncbi:MAG: hypothetical protein IJ242_05345 [Clostridia bacterium]|nr:hypothetical protein [Clostridia bacterium]
MRTFFKGIAILALIVTICAGGLVLYVLETRVPEIQVIASGTLPAQEDENTFRYLAQALQNGTYQGRVFSDETQISADSCTFLAASFRLKNRCLLPMEWIQVDAEPVDGDILELRDEKPHLLNARSEGDLTVNILTHNGTFPAERNIAVSYYILGTPMKTTIRVIWNGETGDRE